MPYLRLVPRPLCSKARLPVVGRAECDDFYGGTLEFEHICAGTGMEAPLGGRWARRLKPRPAPQCDRPRLSGVWSIFTGVPACPEY